MRTFYRTAGIFGVALLTLTACETAGETQPEQDTGQEGADPDGAEDQGNPPEEIADEDDEGEDEEEDPESAEDSGEPPDLAEIEDDVWEASTAQDSVTITGHISPELLGWEDPGAVNDSDEEAAESDPVEVTSAGDLEGDGAIYQVGDVFDYVLFGDDIYQTVDSVVAEYEMAQPEEAESPDADEVREAFDSEGSWVNWGEAGQEYVETPQQFISNFQEEFLRSSDMDSFSELGLEGQSDTEDGEDAWTYRTEQGEDFVELVVLADHSEPLLMGLSYDIGGYEFQIDFSEWNDSEEPEEPEQDEVIPPEEAESIVQSLG